MTTKREAKPNVVVTILPPVYDPERYQRGFQILVNAMHRALLKKLEEERRGASET